VSEVLELTARLVAVESVSGGPGEHAVLDLVEAWFAERGHAVRRHAGASGAALLVAAGAGPSLLFAAHADTVPIGDPGAWTRPPLGGEVHEGRLHGRGASDMKAGLAAAMLAVERGLRAGAPVALGLTTGEEVGCLGAPALATLLDDVEVGALVVPESTDNEIALGHRGATWLRLGADGLAAHGSTPERGRNAVLRLAGALRELPGVPLRSHVHLGHESASVGTIAGGVATNVVPDRCEATVDLRTVEPAGPLVAWWRERDGVDDVEVLLGLDPVWTPPTHPLVEALARWSGADVAATPVSYFTDASVLVDTLGSAVPTVVWGPGDPTTVHTVDESVDVARVVEAHAMYERAVEGWSRHVFTR
jgi:succinyl-diaminopimelate desuccinylase